MVRQLEPCHPLYRSMIRYRSFFDVGVQIFYITVTHFDIEATKEAASSISKLQASISWFNIEVLRYRSVCTSISICVYFDIAAPLFNIVPYIEALRYRGLDTSISKCTKIEDRTRYRSTSISKFTNFDIKVLYTISKIFQKLQYLRQNFDIESQVHKLRYRRFFT